MEVSKYYHYIKNDIWFANITSKKRRTFQIKQCVLSTMNLEYYALSVINIICFLHIVYITQFHNTNIGYMHKCIEKMYILYSRLEANCMK